MGKSTVNGPCSIAMLVYQRVTMQDSFYRFGVKQRQGPEGGERQTYAAARIRL